MTRKYRPCRMTTTPIRIRGRPRKPPVETLAVHVDPAIHHDDPPLDPSPPATVINYNNKYLIIISSRVYIYIYMRVRDVSAL